MCPSLVLFKVEAICWPLQFTLNSTAMSLPLLGINLRSTSKPPDSIDDGGIFKCLAASYMYCLAVAQDSDR